MIVCHFKGGEFGLGLAFTSRHSRHRAKQQLNGQVKIQHEVGMSVFVPC